MSTNSRSRSVAIVVAILVVLFGIGGYWWLRQPKPHARRPPLAVVGVGLYLGRNKDTHKFEVTRIFPNSPAEKAGLIPGLVLNKVGNSLAETNNIKQLSALLMGPAGSIVTVEVIDTNGTASSVDMIREKFVNKSTN